jgi:hypothetical protein
MKNCTLPLLFLTGVMFLLFMTNDTILKNKVTRTNKANIELNDDYLQRIRTIKLELEHSRKQIDSLVLRAADLDSISKVLSGELIQRDVLIRQIRGRYNSISQDSLGQLMDARARTNN